MKNKKILIYSLIAVAIIGAGIFSYKSFYQRKNIHSNKNSASSAKSSAKKFVQSSQYANDPSLVGPGGNVPSGAPSKNDFILFAIPVPGVLSRSGQPTLDNFKWLKANGWKSVVDFREDGEKGNQYALDSKLPGFNDLGLNFLSIPVKDGTSPSNDQATQFLKFVTDSSNQPADVHCAAGIGRTGVAVALYRYSVEGWPMDKAIQEASLFTKNINNSQANWLTKWAANNAPGSYALK